MGQKFASGRVLATSFSSAVVPEGQGHQEVWLIFMLCGDSEFSDNQLLQFIDDLSFIGSESINLINL